MLRVAFVIACCGILIAVSGCAQNSLATQTQLQSANQQALAMMQRNQELQTRADALDRDNQELETLLAQARQQTQVLNDQVAALQDQLGGTTNQLARLKLEYDQVASRVASLESGRDRTRATITANSSVRSQLPALNLPGVEVRVDGDVIRVELPASQLFEPSSARLLGTAPPLVDQVASAVLRAYPRNLIGIEGHTDNEPLPPGSVWTSNHQLGVARAMAVFDLIVSRSRTAPDQLFVTSHGASHPVASNGTPGGQERNRRVELVIYPETLDGR